MKNVRQVIEELESQAEYFRGADLREDSFSEGCLYTMEWLLEFIRRDSEEV